MKIENNRLKIFLVNPPVPTQDSWVREGRCQIMDIWGTTFPPLSLALISRQLTDSGHQTAILDASAERLSADDVLSRIIDFSPDLLVLSTATPTITTDLGWFLPKIKRVFPKIVSVAIGVHVSALPKESLTQFPDLDVIAMREPELTLKDLCSGPLTRASFEKVAGIALRDIDNQPIVNPARELLTNLDSLGFPEWEKINFKNYTLPIFGRPFSMLHFARGCPHKCNYCTAHVYNGRTLRHRSVKSLIEELEYNLSLGIGDFLFWSEMATADGNFLNEFLDEIIQKGLQRKIKWVCNSRVDTVNLELLKKMKRAGCWQIAFGIDFGSDRMYSIAKKGGRANAATAKRAVEWTHQAGIIADGHFMIGYPKETLEDLEKTLSLAKAIPLTFAQFYPVMPYPGADFFDDWAKQNYSNIEQINWGIFDQGRGLIEQNQLSAQQVSSFRGRAYLEFYRRPFILWQILNLPKSPRDFLRLIGATFLFASTLLRRSVLSNIKILLRKRSGKRILQIEAS